MEGYPVPEEDIGDKPIRFIAQDILSKEFIDWELPISGATIQSTLSGPCSIQGTISQAYTRLFESGIDAWATLIHAEKDGTIYGSSILQPIEISGSGLKVDSMGFSGYPKGIPYLQTYQEIQVDPLDIVRHLWQYVQSFPDARIGVDLADKHTSVRVGDPSYYEINLVKNDVGDAQWIKDDSLTKKIGFDTPPDGKPVQDVAKEMLDFVDAGDYAFYEDFSYGGMSQLASDYHDDIARVFYLRNPGVNFSAPSTLDLVKGYLQSITSAIKLVAEAPYELDWWDNKDCGTEIDNLAKSTPFDYAERSYWNDDKSDIIKLIDFGFPRLGRKRFDLVFRDGVNILSAVPNVDLGENYASEIIFLGAGTGRDQIRGEAGKRDAHRVRRVSIKDNKSITNITQANAFAKAYLRATNNNLSVTEITIPAFSENASVGTFSQGDDIFIQLEIPWLGEVQLWHRILSYSLDVDQKQVKIAVQPSDEFIYGIQ